MMSSVVDVMVDMTAAVGGDGRSSSGVSDTLRDSDDAIAMLDPIPVQCFHHVLA